MVAFYQGTTNVYGVHISIAHFFDAFYLRGQNDGEHILVVSGNFLLTTYSFWI
jgi:hypothetical protein